MFAPRMLKQWQHDDDAPGESDPEEGLAHLDLGLDLGSKSQYVD